MSTTKTEPEVKTVEATPVVTTTVTPAKKSGNNTILIIVLIMLVLCCCVTVSAIGGWFYFTSGATRISTLPIVTPEVEVTTAVENIKAFTVAEVKATYLSTKSYHFSGDATFADDSTIEFSGEFLAPNSDHYITTEEDGTVTEEISINGVYYIKEDGGVWEKTTEKYNAGIQREEMLYLLEHMPLTTQPTATDDGFWMYEYIDTAEKETWQLYVSKEEGLPGYLDVSYLDKAGGDVVEHLTFSSYDDSEISIKAPI